jgi:hypothetical protein
MRDTGGMTFSTAQGRKAGQMGPFMKENTWLERSMALVSTVGMMDLNIRVSGTKTKSKVLELIVG